MVQNGSSSQQRNCDWKDTFEVNFDPLDVVVKTFAKTISLTSVAMSGQPLQAPIIIVLHLINTAQCELDVTGDTLYCVMIVLHLIKSNAIADTGHDKNW